MIPVQIALSHSCLLLANAHPAVCVLISVTRICIVAFTVVATAVAIAVATTAVATTAVTTTAVAIRRS